MGEKSVEFCASVRLFELAVVVVVVDEDSVEVLGNKFSASFDKMVVVNQSVVVALSIPSDVVDGAVSGVAFAIGSAPCSGFSVVV